MNRNNDVFNVLVTKGNTAILAKDLPIENLVAGQIGFFNADTHVSVDATSPLPRKIYAALGINRSGGTALEDIRVSAGQYMSRDKLLNFTFEAHSPGRAMVVTVANYLAKCDTEYGINIKFANSRIARLQGQNPFNRNYFVTSGACADCAEGCGTWDANLLSLAMRDQINSDTEKMVVATIVARQALTIVTHGTAVNYANGAVMTSADVNALVNFNKLQTTEAAKVYTNLSITPSAVTVNPFFQVNLNYHKLLETIITVGFTEGFTSSGVITTPVPAVFASGTAINIQQKEYHASAWNGAGPYVLSGTTGTAMGNIEYLTVPGAVYDQFIAEYDIKYPSGWKNYESALSTVFAVPGADTVTRNSLAAFLDAFTPDGFENLLDDVNLANSNPLIVEVAPANVEVDGIA